MSPPAWQEWGTGEGKEEEENGPAVWAYRDMQQAGRPTGGVSVTHRKEGAGRGWGAEVGERSQVYGDGWKLDLSE